MKMAVNDYEATMAQAADKIRELQDENARLKRRVEDLEAALSAEQRKTW